MYNFRSQNKCRKAIYYFDDKQLFIIMSQLSRYIQKQLTTILNKIQRTPPKRCASLHKIKSLVNQAPLTNTQKHKISKSIRKIQSAMQQSSKATIKEVKSKYTKNLFYENMFLQQKNININEREIYQRKSHDEQIQYNMLLQKLQGLRNARLKRQQYLSQLILKTKRMQRLVYLKQQNQQKYLKSKNLEQQSERRKHIQQSIKKQLNTAVKSNKMKSVSVIISKYKDLIKS